MKKTTISMIIIIFVLASIIYYVIALRMEYNRNQVFKEDYDNKDFRNMYSFFVLNNPLLSNRYYLGKENASITLVVVIDFKSGVGKKFYYEKVPEIKKLYVDPGYAKLYYKYYVTQDEFNRKKGRFIYAQAVQCYTKLYGRATEKFHKALFNTTEQNISLLADTFAIPIKDFEECMNKSSFRVIQEDMIETMMFRIQGPSIQIGIDGRDNTVLYGNPSISRINRTIRLKEIKIGI